MLPSEDELSDEEVARCILLCDRTRERYQDALARCRTLQESDTLRGRRVVPLVGIFPPVTQEQVNEAEERIGFRLPLLLRFLYMTVANGCFEPDKPGNPGWSAFLGIAGGYYSGYPHPCPPAYRWTMENTTSHSGWRLDGDTERLLIADRNRTVVCFDTTPDGFASICDVGCDGSYELDLYTGHIYESWCYPLPDAIEDAGLMQALHERDHSYLTGINHIYSSLEELFEAWLTSSRSPVMGWEHQRPTCLGLVGPHGITSAAYFEPDESQAPSEDNRLDDEFFDSDDWRWYLQQPPLDAE